MEKQQYATLGTLSLARYKTNKARLFCYCYFCDVAKAEPRAVWSKTLKSLNENFFNAINKKYVFLGGTRVEITWKSI
jgi:hypothetical protein